MTGTTRDAFLGGQLEILQPAKGYRAGLDPVLLAAACPARVGQSVLELGCGVGTASLCLGARVGDLSLCGVEILPDYADLARENAANNGQELKVETADLTQKPSPFYDRSFDHVMLNPPYFRQDTGLAPQDVARASGRRETDGLDIWVHVAARRLKPKGIMTMIQRVERLPDILAAVSKRLGTIEVQPLSPRMGQTAHLILLRARKSGKAPFKLHAAVPLHHCDGHVEGASNYAGPIEAVLRQGAALNWGGA